ncbi:MAG: hypothetical protein P8X73_06375, partial [Ignavibacteriaceae bacterium]
NSSLAKGLFKLANYYFNNEFKEISVKMLSKMKESFISTPSYYSNWGSLMIDMVYPFYEVAIVGADYENKLKTLSSDYYPNILLLGGTDEGTLELLDSKLVNGKTLIYVCEDKNCKLPVEEISAAIEQLN